MKLALLVNPSAGRGRSRRLIARAIDCLRLGGAELTVLESRDREHLVDLASMVSSERFDRVVSCGGDGTLHLVLRGLDLKEAVLGILPLGSGDDFARVLGVSRRIEDACATLLEGVVKEVDVATANGIRYLGVAGIGFDSEVARYANERVRFLRGSLIYLYSVFRVLGKFEPHRIQLDLDDERSDLDVMFVVVGNSSQYGGGIRIVPTAEVDDGFLDLCVVARCSRWQLVKTLPLAYNGRHVSSPFVTLGRGKRIRVESDEPLDVYADGEPVTRTPVEFGLEKERLRVVVPLERSKIESKE